MDPQALKAWAWVLMDPRALKSLGPGPRRPKGPSQTFLGKRCNTKQSKINKVLGSFWCYVLHVHDEAISAQQQQQQQQQQQKR